MTTPRVLLTLALVLVGVACPASAGTLRVPKDFKTIQAAVDAAKPGDTVLVEAGTYRESVRLKERVTLQSAGDDAVGKVGLKRAEATIIDGGGDAPKAPAVVMAEGAVLDGFTVTRAGLFDQKEYDWHYATHGDLLPDERGAVGIKEFPALGAWKLVVVHGKTTTYKLYHLASDPQMKKDLAAQIDNLVLRLRGRLERQEAVEFKTMARKESGGK